MNTHGDTWCRENTVAPRRGHAGTLGAARRNILRVEGARAEGCAGGFPKSMDGYAFMAFHGSWNRDTPTGYKIVSLAMTEEDGLPVKGAEPVDLLAHRGDGAK